MQALFANSGARTGSSTVVEDVVSGRVQRTPLPSRVIDFSGGTSAYYTSSTTCTASSRIACQVKFKRAATTSKEVLVSLSDGTATVEIGIAATTSYPYVTRDDGTTSQTEALGTTAVDDDAWHTLLVSIESATTVKAYLDGKLLHEATVTSVDLSSVAWDSVRIGADHTATPANHYAGSMSHFVLMTGAVIGLDTAWKLCRCWSKYYAHQSISSTLATLVGHSTIQVLWDDPCVAAGSDPFAMGCKAGEAFVGSGTAGAMCVADGTQRCDYNATGGYDASGLMGTVYWDNADSVVAPSGAYAPTLLTDETKSVLYASGGTQYDTETPAPCKLPGLITSGSIPSGASVFDSSFGASANLDRTGGIANIDALTSQPYGASFNGSSSQIAFETQMGNVLGTDGDYVEFYMYRTANADETVIGDSAGAGRLAVQTTTIEVGTAGGTITLDSALPTSEFVKVKVANDGGTLRAYINGVQQAGTMAAASFDPDVIGQNNSLNWFTGYLRGLKIYQNGNLVEFDLCGDALDSGGDENHGTPTDITWLTESADTTEVYTGDNDGQFMNYSRKQV